MTKDYNERFHSKRCSKDLSVTFPGTGDAVRGKTVPLHLVEETGRLGSHHRRVRWEPVMSEHSRPQTQQGATPWWRG